MEVTFPKGFLEKLSGKCRQELEKAASEFEYEFTMSGEHQINYDDRLRGNGPGTMNYYTFGHTTIKGEFMRRNRKGSLFKLKGFVLREKSFVSEDFTEYDQLEKDSKELKMLKASLGNLKNVIGELK